jgi:type VI secretion system protein ImpC
MPRPFSGSTVEIDIGTEMERVPAPPEPDTPFRILIAGDFSGRKNRGIFQPGLSRLPIEVDRDNFDLVLGELRPALRLPATMSFRELEDFEPDRLFDRLELFQALRQGLAAAAAEPAPAAPPTGTALENLLARTLEETESREASRPKRALDDLSALVREIVAPHLEPKPDPRQAELASRIDAANAAGMRVLLHHPDFQALEAAWRGLDFLVRRLETGPMLKLYILDVTKEELAAELRDAGDLRGTELYRILARDPEPWAVWAGNFTFDGSIDDLVLLGYFGGIARAANAPFLAAASPRLAGCESFAPSPLPEPAPSPCAIWQELRVLPEASWLGLALPRFLLRLPYGTATCPVERFAFEEMPGGRDHEAYLWGNPAFACLCLLGQAFEHAGWSLKPGTIRDIEGLPVHVYREAGEAQLKPCAETLLAEANAERMLELGLMPLLSLKGRDAVRLMRFQSLADPPAPLSGRWRSR